MRGKAYLKFALFDKSLCAESAWERLDVIVLEPDMIVEVDFSFERLVTHLTLVRRFNM